MTDPVPSPETPPPTPGIWERWELRNRLLLPVSSSLTTAAIIFAVAAIFAPTIRNLFSQPGTPGFPIYCTVEPYNAPGSDTVLVDLTVLNLSAVQQTGRMLDGLVDKNAGHTASLVLRADHAFVDSIVRVEPAAPENREKGEMTFTRIGPREYHAQVAKIEPSALLRYTIVTNMVTPVSSRANRSSNPVSCSGQFRGEFTQ